MSNYRHFIRTAAGCDGATADVGPYTQIGLVWTTANTGAVGLFGPSILGRSDVNNNPRTVSIARVCLSGTVLGLNTVEVVNAAGQSRIARPASLDSSGWMWLNPDDSIRVTAAGATGLELFILDLDSAAALAWASGEACCGTSSSENCCETSSITVTESTTLLPWANTLFVFVNGPLDTTTVITLTAFADITLNRRAVVVRVGGGVVVVIPTTGESMNGKVNGIVELDGFGGVIFDRREVTWTSTKPNMATAQTLEIANPGDTVTIAPPTGVMDPVRIEATASGFARLPTIINWPTTDYFPITRNGGTGQIIIIPFAGEILNGEVDGRVFLGFNDVALAHKTPFGAVVVTSSGSRPIRCLTLAANATLDFFGAAIVVNATQAAAQNVNLPPTGTNEVMPGARARFCCKGVGGLTIGGNGSLIAPGSGGAAAANLVIAQNETTDLVWDTTQWIAVGNP